jgi:hypothetical protein
VPNGEARLTVSVGTGAANGTYAVSVQAAGVDRVAVASVVVEVGDAFALVAEPLGAGMTGVSYRATVRSVNGVEPVRYALVEGKLPVGLRLSETGEITGNPREAGVKSFVVSGTDAEGRSARAGYEIRVEESAWALGEKDGGRSRYAAVPSPADGSERYGSATYREASELLVGANRVFVQTPDSVVGLEQSTGALRYRLEGRIERTAYVGGTLFVQTEGTLRAFDPSWGRVRWQREGVRDFSTDGSVVLAALAEGGMAELDAGSGDLRALLPDGLPEGGILLWQGGRLYRAWGPTLYRYERPGWSVVYAGSAEIVEAVADTEGMYLVLADGRLVEPGGAEVQLPGMGELSVAEAALGGRAVVVAAGGSLVGLDRRTLGLLYARPALAGALAAAEEKVFLGTAEELVAYNGYDGSAIWARRGGVADVALAGEVLYALGTDGKVVAFDGPDNPSYPSTELVLSPAAPDGLSGYYVSQPTLELAATDRESYVASRHLKVGEASWAVHEEPAVLPEGEYGLKAYSVDNHGYREPDRVANVRVDVTDPVSVLVAERTEGLGGYMTSEVVVSLAATDNLSGLARIEVGVDAAAAAEYGGAVRLTTEGAHTVRWAAVDHAGNREEEREAAYALDLENPTVRLESTRQPGLSVVYLYAGDTPQGSGVERIEYRIDSGLAQVYVDPVVLTAAGVHEVSYRSVDVAGRTSGWQAESLEVLRYEPGQWVQELKFAYWMPGREVVRDVEEGVALYWPVMGRQNRIDGLPEYLKRADYLRTNVADKEYGGREFVSFTAGADVEVYVLKHEASRARLDGWELVERDFPVEPEQYFRGGADVYRKSYRQGARVVIPGSASERGGWGNLIFVQYAPTNYMVITSPRAGELEPIERVRYAGTTLVEQATEYRWSVQYGEEPEVALPGVSGELELPYTAGKLRMWLGMETELGRRVGVYDIRNRAALEVKSPGPGVELEAGSQVEVAYTVRDLGGRELPWSAVAWESSRDGKSWQEEKLQGGRLLSVPLEPGPLYLRGRFNEEPTGRYVRERVVRFRVVEEIEPAVFWFGERALLEQGETEAGVPIGWPVVPDGLRGVRVADGAVYGEQEGGLEYGFGVPVERYGAMAVEEHAEESPRPWWDEDERDWGERDEREMWQERDRGPGGEEEPERFIAAYLRLEDGERFSVHVGAGRYRVKLTVGPVSGRQRLDVQVGEDNVRLRGERRASVWEIEREVELRGEGVLVVGGDGVRLVALELERLDADAPAVKARSGVLRQVEVVRVWEGERYERWREADRERRGGWRRGLR